MCVAGKGNDDIERGGVLFGDAHPIGLKEEEEERRKALIAMLQKQRENF